LFDRNTPIDEVNGRLSKESRATVAVHQRHESAAVTARIVHGTSSYDAEVP
jgi:hypothetical protein